MIRPLATMAAVFTLTVCTAAPVIPGPADANAVVPVISPADFSVSSAKPAGVARTATLTDPVKVVAAGDIACEPGSSVSSDNCRQKATARLVRSLNPDQVLALGDLQYENGSLRRFRRSYDPTWGTLKDITKPVPGNHEYKTSGAAGFYDYFGVSAPGYRMAKMGSWRIFLLNSQCESINCDRQQRWLRRKLAANPSDCSAIVMHYPRYSSGSEHGSNASMSRFWRIALNHGVDLALAGHDHEYERFAPMDADGNRTAGGITSFVVGTGGRSLYSKGAEVPGSRYFKADKFGVLVLKLDTGKFSWRFRTLSGGVRDAGSHSCH